LFDVYSPILSSANGCNCQELAQQSDINGFLVGGTSVKPEFE
jgi:triosephosphate isomerase